MRILVLTQVVPFPPDSGPKIKTYATLRYLTQRHEVHLMSFVRSADEVGAARLLEDYCRSVTTVPIARSKIADVGYLVRSLATGRPFLVERDDQQAMHAAVADLLARYAFDAVHADQETMGQFAVDLRVPLRVFDKHNAVWTTLRRLAERQRGVLRLLLEVEWRKMRAYEGQLCRAFDQITVVSAEDQRYLEDAAGAPLRATTIPIAVDTDQLAFRSPAAQARDVLSVATMFYPPNVEGVRWFATESFPKVTAAVPDAKFRIVGSRPPKSIRSLPQTHQQIEVTGYVPDLDPLLHQSRVLVVPVRSGSGMRVKILEAFARGIPVVSTSVGVEGIAARDGEHLLIADDPDSFACAVVRLLTDLPGATRLAQAGRTLVEQHYDWRTALRPLDAVYAG